MTGILQALKLILKAVVFNLPAKQSLVTFLLLTLLMPIAAPAMLQDHSLSVKPIFDSGLRLSAPQPSLFASSMSFFTDLFSGVGMFIASPVKGEKESGKADSKKTLERKIIRFETQIADEEEIKVGQILSLAAMPVDKNGNPISGLDLQWFSQNSGIVKIINDSQAIALREGKAKLTVSTGKFKKEIDVKVFGSSLSDSSSTFKKEIRLSSTSTTPTAQQVQPVLSEQQAESMVAPENNLGTPIGQTEMSSPSSASATKTRERFGSANYSFGIPVASLSGRGIDTNVGIVYNSRVWSKSEYGGTKIFDFNANKNWLAPGFEMGYGSIEGYNTAYGNGLGYLLNAPDGSRQQLIYKQTNGNCYTYESTDGTFIKTTVCGTYFYNTPILTVLYPDGSKVVYGAITSGSKRFPISITDRNGNKISIAYLQNDSVGKIAYIQDTLGRYITFYYDNTAEKNLIAVTVPGYNDSATPRQTIRFYYEDISLQWQNRFQDTAQVNAPTNPIKILRYVYFPGTQSGYKYDYSPYFGMIYKIWQMRGMVISTNSLTETGSVTNEGDWAAWTQYNYAATAVELGGIPLVDVPKYSWRKDDWQGRTAPSYAQTFFDTQEQTQANAQGVQVGDRITKISAPDGTINVSISNINPNEWNNGLLTQTKLITIENSQEKIWAKTKMYWLQGSNQPQGRDNPRLDKIEVTNDVGQIKATSFEYDGYNNQKTVVEHDFAAEDQLGTELRRTETTYETGAGWINNRLLRLPQTIKTTVNNVVVSKIVIEYDGNPLTNYGANPITQHEPSHNSGVPDQVSCHLECPSNCNGQTYSPCSCPQEEVCETTSTFNPNTNYRGNVTKATAFSDATLETDSNAVVSTMKYDVTGNEVEAGVNCCKKKTWTYNQTYEYAYPVSEARGDGGQLTSSITYDKNTGLVKTSTDENNQLTTFSYNPDNLRLIRVDSPNGAWSTTEYNDLTYPYYVKSTASLDQTRSVSGWSYADGRGQGFRSRSQTTNGYISGDVEFDVMGRAIKSYNPYTVTNLADPRPSGIKYSEITQRDGLGRVLQSRLPDLTTVSAAYSGLVMTATDQAGKSRRQIADSLGRIARVDEPNSSGSLGDVNAPVQPTSYEYDGNDNLKKVTQSVSGTVQERIFKYDSLSRLTHERQVEATATLNNEGVKTGTGGVWTGVYKYNAESLVSEGTDARGVKTTFGYDGLNRLWMVAYSGEVGYQTPQVTYSYDEPRNDANQNPYYNKGRLTKVKTVVNTNQETPETVQTYDYDKVGQVVNHTQSIGNQSYNLQYGYNLAGQLVSEKYPSGKVFNFAVDAAGRLSTVSDSQRTYLSGVSFNDRGLLSQINLGNGTSETFSYNDRFQMESQALLKGAEVLQKYDYSFGKVDLAAGTVDAAKNNGQLGKIESYIGAGKQWSQRFAYDELGRLGEAGEYKAGDNNQLSYKQKFDYDRFGNLYRKIAANPTAGQQNPLVFTPIAETDINKQKNQFTTGTTYDEAGQVTTDNKFRQMNFAYDANGRQVVAARANTPDAKTVYDALGNRVATKMYGVWQYVVYDAFGKLVAEYGIAAESSGGVKYVQQDWQGSVRTVTNNNGFVVARTDHQAFGEDVGLGVGLRSIEQGYNTDKVTRQGYGLTENDKATGQQHTWFRKLETMAGRWTRPDPYKGSMSVGNPQSFNRYSYVGNDPLNYFDPKGLYEACVHQAMTKFLGELAGLKSIASRIAHYTGDGLQAADSSKYAATSPFNIAENLINGRGTSADIHFPSKERLENEIRNYPNYVKQGLGGDSRGYQSAGFVLHAIQDGLGAHVGYSLPEGHAAANARGVSPDRIIGDANFLVAAITTYKVMKNDPKAGLTPQQVNALIDAIVAGCGNKFDLQITRPTSSGGGVAGGGDASGGYIGGGGYPPWWWSLQGFLAELAELGNEGTVTITGYCVGGNCS